MEVQNAIEKTMGGITKGLLFFSRCMDPMQTTKANSGQILGHLVGHMVRIFCIWYILSAD